MSKQRKELGLPIINAHAAGVDIGARIPQGQPRPSEPLGAPVDGYYLQDRQLGFGLST
jgi:hypothetical protein